VDDAKTVFSRSDAAALVVRSVPKPARLADELLESPEVAEPSEYMTPVVRLPFPEFSGEANGKRCPETFDPGFKFCFDFFAARARVWPHPCVTWLASLLRL
jgi:hypothetical protein